MNMSVKGSSVAKGETLARHRHDTQRHASRTFWWCRHGASGAAELLAQKVGCAVVNAGDGQHEHPTQALLDALTIQATGSASWKA